MISIHDVYRSALALNPREQAELVDRLIAQLDQPDRIIDELWMNEAESRINAFDQGKIKAIPLNEVLGKYFNA